MPFGDGEVTLGRTHAAERIDVVEHLLGGGTVTRSVAVTGARLVLALAEQVTVTGTVVPVEWLEVRLA